MIALLFQQYGVDPGGLAQFADDLADGLVGVDVVVPGSDAFFPGDIPLLFDAQIVAMDLDVVPRCVGKKMRSKSR